MYELMHFYDRRIGEGCFHVVDNKLYYYATLFSGFSDNDSSCLVRYEVKEKTGYYQYTTVVDNKEARMNVMDVSICDDKLFYLRKNSLKECQVRYYEMDGLNVTGISTMVMSNGYYPMINDSVRQTESGRILCPMAKHPFSAKFQRASCFVMYSDDHGKTWKKSNVLRPPFWLKHGYQEPVVEEIDSGRCIMLMRSGDGWVYSSQSWDEGATWSNPKRWLAGPLSPIHIKKMGTGFILAGNHRLESIPGVSLGQARTPLRMTRLNADFEFKGSELLEHSLYGFYCYVSSIWFEDHYYLAYYTGTDPFKEFKIIRI